MKTKNFLALIAISLVFAACQKEEVAPVQNQTGNLELKFDNVFGKENLQIGDKTYLTAHGEEVKVSMLRYFVSNFKVKTTDGKEVVLPQDSCYFLIDESIVSSQKVLLKNLPEGNYSEVSFILGVDSLRNTMDVAKRKGSLDVGGQAAGMYWTWNSGYIFFKLEGDSPQAPENAGRRAFRFHIGGFGGMNSATINNIKTIRLAIKDQAKVRKNNTPSVHILTDISKVFSGKNVVKIAENPTVMFNAFSPKIAENYTEMFSVDHVH